MQRLFFAFPGGLPGFGLLLLRLATSLTALYEERTLRPFQEMSSSVHWLLLTSGLVAIILVLIGLLTPIGCLLVALETLKVLSSLLAGRLGSPVDVLLAVDLIVMASVSAAVGPGAFSLDARLFGRREIVFPHGPVSRGLPKDHSE